MSYSRSLLLFCAPLVLTACASLEPDLRRPEALLPSPMPESYASAPDSTPYAVQAENEAPSAWWHDFTSQDLNQLINASLTKNFDVLSAWASLRQSEAAARSAHASFFPSLDASGSASTSRLRSETSSSSSEYAYRSFGLGVAASYEVDLWGQVSASYEADRLRYTATAHDLATAQTSVVASVADTWAALLGNRAELLVVKEQIEINQDLIDMHIVRFANGLGDSLTILQQQEVLAALEADIPSIEYEATTLRNQLALLVGTLPSGELGIDENAALPILKSMPRGLPVELLNARPDIQSAWARLVASDWDYSATLANRYPSLKLSASAAFDASQSSLLFSNWVASLVGSVAMPLFDGGSRDAEEARVRAVTEGLVQTYAKTVATAIQEVDNALAAEQAAHASLRLLDARYVYAKAAMIEARNSYLGGVGDFLNYISQFKNVQSLERSLVAQQTSVVQARITLHRCLGGTSFSDYEQSSAS